MGRSISVALHITLVLLMVLAPKPSMQHHKPEPPQNQTLMLFHLAPLHHADHGGGGNESKIPPSKGRLPRFTPRHFILPAQSTKQLPALVVEPMLPGPEDLSVPNIDMAQFGDPFAKNGPFSLGPGKRGIGSGDEGYGNKPGSGISGDAEPIADGPITGPEVIYKTEPEFSEEARKAKLQGTVVLEAHIGRDGRVHDVRVRNGLGLGLDEKALEAVRRWRFRPAMRRGKPVVVAAVIEINFRLL